MLLSCLQVLSRSQSSDLITATACYQLGKSVHDHGRRENRGEQNLEADWTNHLSVTFKWINQIFPRSEAQGFLVH